jgi:predicted GNAT family acetyltransferase
MDASVTDQPEQQRFELRRGDGELLGWLDYRAAGPSVILAHTEVGTEHEGGGYGGQLVREAIAAVRADGRTVIPTCPFAAAYIARHPELVDDVAPAWQARFQG